MRYKQEKITRPRISESNEDGISRQHMEGDCKNMQKPCVGIRQGKSSVSGMQRTFSSIAKLDWISEGEFPMDGLRMKHPNQFDSAFKQWNSFFITPTPLLLYCHHWYWHLAQSFTILHQQRFTSTPFEHKNAKHHLQNTTTEAPPPPPPPPHLMTDAQIQMWMFKLDNIWRHLITIQFFAVNQFLHVHTRDPIIWYHVSWLSSCN